MLALTVCMSTTGCLSAGNGPPERSSNAPSTHAAMNRPADMQRQIDAAIADASTRTGVASGSIKIVSAEAVTWSDGSLGCPQPGMAYTQALVPGYRIRIDAAGRSLDYHAGVRGLPVYCPPDRAREPLPGGGRS
jgi:hypothetical protein